MLTEGLMINDWLCYGGHNVQVKGIDFPFKGKSAYISFGAAEFYPCDNFSPISLTPEILEKNGFVANKHVYPYPYYEYEVKEIKLKIGFAFPQGNRTSYKEPWIYIDSEHVFIEHLPCIYVHQLQNILRLCKIKKEIIL